MTVHAKVREARAALRDLVDGKREDVQRVRYLVLDAFDYLEPSSGGFTVTGPLTDEAAAIVKDAFEDAPKRRLAAAQELWGKKEGKDLVPLLSAHAIQILDELADTKEELRDVALVLANFAGNAARCKSCRRKTVVKGYVCFACGEDPTVKED